MAETFAPPLEPTGEIEPPRARWPIVIGVLSLSYALIGGSCLAFGNVWMLMSESIPEMYGGGASVPPVMKGFFAFGLVTTLALGIMLMVGAIKLIRRRRSGARLLKAWVVMRLCLLAASLVLSFLTVEVQMEMDRSMNKKLTQRKEEMEREGNPGAAWIYINEMEPAAHRRSKINTAVGFTAAMALYPLFLGFYLSRRKISDQVEHWE